MKRLLGGASGSFTGGDWACMRRNAHLRRYWRNRRTQSLAWSLLLLVPTASRLAYGDPQVQYLSLGIYALLAAGWALVVLRRRLPIVLPRFLLPLFVYVGWMPILLPVLSRVVACMGDRARPLPAQRPLADAVHPVPNRGRPQAAPKQPVGAWDTVFPANPVYVGVALGVLGRRDRQRRSDSSLRLPTPRGISRPP